MRKKGEKRGPTLLDFVEQKEERKIEEKPKDVADDLYSFLKAQKRATKDEVMRWAKERGISTADLLRAVEKLSSARLIKKRLDDEGNLIYEA